MPAKSQRHQDQALAKATSLARKALPDDALLHEALGTLIARWLDAKPGRLARDHRGHLRLAPAARGTIEVVCRDVAWMLDPNRHHGQQPAALAGKTLRALRDRRIDWPALVRRCDEFRRLRQAAIRRNAARRPRAEAESIALPRAEATATRVVTERDLILLGREARNCLSSKEHGSHYRRLLRKEEAEFWRIDDASGLLCVAQIDAEGGKLDRVEGPGGSDLSPRSAAALLEFLRARRVTVGSAAGGLIAHGIYDEVVLAPGEPDRLEAVLHGARWALEFVPGAVLARCKENMAEWVLRPACPTGTRCGLVELAAATDEDIWADDALPYAYEAWVRTGLRRACREDPALLRACTEAFHESPDVFREDWFDLGSYSTATAGTKG